MKKILFLLLFMPFLGMSQTWYSPNIVGGSGITVTKTINSFTISTNGSGNDTIHIPFTGALKDANFNNKKFLNIGFLGVGTSALIGNTKLQVGDTAISGVNNIAIAGNVKTNNSEIGNLYFFNAGARVGVIRSQRLYNNNSGALFLGTSDSLGNITYGVKISTRGRVGIKNRYPDVLYSLDVPGITNCDTGKIGVLEFAGNTTGLKTGTGALVFASSPSLTGTLVVPAITTTAITTTSLTIGSALNPLIQTISTSTITPDGNYNFGYLGSISTTISIVNPSITFATGKGWLLFLKDNGVARAITFGNLYVSATTDALPTTTTAGKVTELYIIENPIDSNYLVFAKSQ